MVVSGRSEVSFDPERTYEEHSHKAAYDGRATEVPDKVRISDDRREGQVDHVGEASVQEVDGGDEASHVDGRTRVSNSVGCIPR